LCSPQSLTKNSLHPLLKLPRRLGNKASTYPDVRIAETGSLPWCVRRSFSGLERRHGKSSIRGDHGLLYAGYDAGYQEQIKVIHAAAPNAKDSTSLGARIKGGGNRWRNARIAPGAECAARWNTHPHVEACLWLREGELPGLKKNHDRLLMAFAPINIYQRRRRLATINYGWPSRGVLLETMCGLQRKRQQKNQENAGLSLCRKIPESGLLTRCS
jgi:hypothetical protein